MIVVLRLNHRRERDKRVSTHIGLVARAFGADKVVYTGDSDEALIKSLQTVVLGWGGSFAADYEKDYRKVIMDYASKGFKIVHLTMYGLPLEEQATNLRKHKNLLIIVGGEKVPGDVYEAADYNISVTNQPHSEIAALALTLDRVFKGKEFELRFKGAQKVIKPDPKGKSFL
ncbi:MAG: tRNA (cytidine(56)-2'-O)-methyltransferase [Nanoarchaeota archaeon]|nr:tRNA (cytidine(56)-2'-O)-methyltransferase [Nanoarchaeota archaeon]